MSLDRREFLRRTGAAGIALPVLGTHPAVASEAMGAASADSMGVLVDIPNCIGCRACEFACQEAAGFNPPPIETFEDKSVFVEHRRPHPRSYTTVNEFPNPADAAKRVYVKSNCLHCVDPACVSACLVGAFKKQADGAVTYDAWKCMGCRYCMVACPFQIPTYDYDNALTPQVRKCNLCFDRISKEGGVPACVKMCPRECLHFGRRSDLLTLAHQRIRERPNEYLDHVYGEREAGGTSWLYLSSVPFEQLGFVSLGPDAPPRLTEAVQHGIFKFFLPPLALYGLLGLVMWLAKPDARAGADEAAARDEALQPLSRTGNGRGARDEPGHRRVPERHRKGVSV